MIMASRLAFSSVAIFAILLLCLIINGTFAGPNPQESVGVAMNADGKGAVMVSCNGKTVKGEGAAACMSAASYLGKGPSMDQFIMVLSAIGTAVLGTCTYKMQL